MTTSTQSATAAGLRLELPVSTRQLDTHWAACVPNLGITVFANTEPAARQRMTTALQFLTETAISPGPTTRQEFKEYLQTHAIIFSDLVGPDA